MSFEDVMMKRLAKCHAEACREILAYVRAGSPLSDAVSFTIKQLPANKTRELRRWLEDWEAWEEWKTWQAKGWRVRKHGKGIITLVTPPATAAMPYGFHGNKWPTERVVAAGAGVRAVKDARGGWERFEDARGKERFDRAYEVVEGAES